MKASGLATLLDIVADTCATVDTTTDDSWLLLDRIPVVRIELDRLEQRIRSGLNGTPQPKSPPPAPPPKPPADPKGK